MLNNTNNDISLNPQPRAVFLVSREVKHDSILNIQLVDGNKRFFLKCACIFYISRSMDCFETMNGVYQTIYLCYLVKAAFTRQTNVGQLVLTNSNWCV